MERLPLSASTDGKGILVTDTSSPGTEFHSVPQGSIDKIQLWAVCTHTGDVLLSLEIGGAGAANTIEATIPGDSSSPAGPTKVLMPGEDEGLWIFGSGGAISLAAFAATTDVVTLLGYVERDRA